MVNNSTWVKYFSSKTKNTKETKGWTWRCHAFEDGEGRDGGKDTERNGSHGTREFVVYFKTIEYIWTVCLLICS